MRLRITLLALMALCISCGGSSSGDDFPDDVPTHSSPVINRIDPMSGAVGDTISVYGFGFSIVPQNNIISIGESVTTAETYALTDNTIPGEIEILTFVLPSDVVVGTFPLIVTTNGRPSNTTVSIEIIP